MQGKEENKMIHEMKLRPEYYNFILNGTKRIEIRLNDEKRQKIQLGDKIKFLFNDYDISTLADQSMTKEELISVLEQFYTKEKQKKYGVLGIRIDLI